MKTLRNLAFLLLAPLMVVSCSKDYDEPLLSPPVYSGPKANMTIEKFKADYGQITDPTHIEYDHIIKGYISGNDISGNIYKQIYVQDATGGINLGVDQSSTYTTYQVGQEVYINLHGLSAVKYGGELQIGYSNTQANRISWDKFQDHVLRNDWANSNNVEPKVITLDNLTNDMVNTLVRINDIYFVDEGKLDAKGDSLALTENQATTNRTIQDVNGKSIDVRTSSFSATLAKKVIPRKYGSVVGILGRYNSGWQFFLRDANDIKQFGKEGPTKPEPPVETSIFNETFGTGTYPSSNRPKIATFTDFDMKAPIVYSDVSGLADIRSIAGDNGAHVWLPAGADRNSYLTIKGIKTTSHPGMVLSFQLAANLFNPTDASNLNVIKVSVNGVQATMPSIPVSNANGDNSKFYTIELTSLPIPETDDLTIEFFSDGSINTVGMRLDNIKLSPASSTITPTPGK